MSAPDYMRNATRKIFLAFNGASTDAKRSETSPGAVIYEGISLLQDPLNDNDEPRPVMIITGRIWKKKGGKPEGVHVMLMAPDDDSAVRRALESLAAEGYAEAELDQIGEMQEEPDEEPHLSAYQGALEGEVSIVTFDEPI